MTEQEAIKIMKYYSEEDYGVGSMVAVSHQMAIKALEEIQQYRALGTVEVLRIAMNKQVAKTPLLSLCGDCQKDCIDCDRYEDRCPNCNSGLYNESGKSYKFCPTCGQKLAQYDK